jgi:hypothetical protein
MPPTSTSSLIWEAVTPASLRQSRTGLLGALEERVGELFELGAGEGELDVLGSGGIGRDEGQADVVGLRGGKGDLGFFRFLLDALEGVGLAGEIDALVLFELADDPLDERVVPVVAAELGVAIGGEHFEDAVADFEHRDIEGAAAEVIDGDFFVGFLVEAVGEGGGGGLVDDAEHFEAGDFTGGLGGVALGVVEIGGHGDDGLLDGFAEFGFGVGLEFAEHHGGDFLRREGFGFAGDFHLDVGVAIGGGDDLVGHALVGLGEFGELAADQAFGGENRVFRVGDGLAFGGLADEALAVFGEGDHRGVVRAPSEFSSTWARRLP